MLSVLMGAGCVGCSRPNPWVRVVYSPDGVLGVEGPAAGPFKTKGELAATACQLMIDQPGASAERGPRGVEYCALYYYSKQDEAYFLSYFSDVRAIESEARKECYAYSYNYSTRVVSALRNGEWVAIGVAEGRYGSLRLYEGQSWFPSK